jgi:hypothetical protein
MAKVPEVNVNKPPTVALAFKFKLRPLTAAVKLFSTVLLVGNSGPVVVSAAVLL